MKGKLKKALALCLGVVIAFGSGNVLTVKADTCTGITGGEIFKPEEGDIIPCHILHWVIRAKLGISKTYVKLTPDHLKGIDDISYEDGSHPEAFDFDAKIYNLIGLEHAHDLKTMILSYNAITDLTPIKDLKKLETLVLKNNQAGSTKLSDISPIKNITSLKDIAMEENAIENIEALSRLTNLEKLALSGNIVQDLEPLKNLTNIKKLLLNKCVIKDISPLERLTKMEDMLWLGNNQITDISALKDMKLLKELRLEENTIKDITPLKQLTSLSFLDLSGNTGIKDYGPLTGLINLEENQLFLTRTGIADQKEELFQVINVNKLLSKFHANSITLADKGNVSATRAAFAALTTKQQSYIEEKRITYAENNIKLLEQGKEIVNYPDLGESSEEEVVLQTLTANVVDGKGNPLSGVKFLLKPKYGNEVKLTSDDKGKVQYTLSLYDSYANFSLSLAEDAGYTSDIADVKFTVSGIFSNPTATGQIVKIETIDGKPVTGKENLTFTLTKKDGETVDKTSLKEKIDAAKVYKADTYTAESFKALQDEITKAEAVYTKADATKAEVDQAVKDLQIKIDGLAKTEAVKTRKFQAKVVDKEGNPISGMKWSIKSPNVNWDWETTNANGLISYTVSAYKDTYTCKLVTEEYTVNPESMVIETAGTDGDAYISKVNGKAMDGIIPTFTLTKKGESAVDKIALKEKIDVAKEYKADAYTAESFKALQDEITKAEAVYAKADAAKAEVDQAVADIQGKIEGLVATEAKMKTFTAKVVDKDNNPLQGVKFKVTSFGVNMPIESDQNGTISYAVPQESESAAYTCELANGEKYKAEPAAITFKTEKANGGVYISTINDKPVNGSTNLTFKLTKQDQGTEDTFLQTLSIKITDSKGKPLAGVRFLMKNAFGYETYLTSDENGILSYKVSVIDGNDELTISLPVDSEYASEIKEIKFKVSTSGQTAKIESINGQPVTGNENLTFILTKEGETTVDKVNLKTIIDSAKAVKKAQYTEESYNALQTVLAEAETVYAAADTTQETVDKITASLKTAIDGLVKKGAPLPGEKNPETPGGTVTTPGNVVIKPSDTQAAKTGDTVNPFMWLILVGASGMALGLMLKKMKKAN